MIQGTFLGHFLFVMYMNDVPSYVKDIMYLFILGHPMAHENAIITKIVI